MKINHSLDDIIDNFEYFLLVELFFLFVNLVKETAVLQVLSDELVLISGNANSHVKNNIWMFETTQNLKLLEEVFLVLVFPCFYVIFDGHGTGHVLSFVDFAESALSDKLE